MNRLTQLWNDERGFVVSAEIVLVLTIGVLGCIVGLNSVAGSVNHELNDLSGALGSMNQSYSYRGFRKSTHASVAGAAYRDGRDFCDCTAIIQSYAVPSVHDTYAAPVYAAPMVVPPFLAPEVPCVTGDCITTEPCDVCEQTLIPNTVPNTVPNNDPSNLKPVPELIPLPAPETKKTDKKQTGK